MEHHKRRRGISLIHHERKPSLPIEVPITSRAPVTHFHYSRYPTSQPTIRHVSAPRPNIHFCYQVNPETTKQHLNIQAPPSHLQTSVVEKITTPKALNEPVIVKQVSNKKEQQDVDRYYSFEHCKEVIANRLFGNSPSSKRENSSESRYQEAVTVNIKSAPETKVCPFSQIVKMPLEASSRLNILQRSQQQKEVSTVRDKKMIRQNAENIKIEPQDKEVLKMRKPKRNPVNLHDMEKRLMEIIKICDETL